jgi:hypothetical protein
MLEGEKYDMEKEVELKDYRVCNSNIRWRLWIQLVINLII